MNKTFQTIIISALTVGILNGNICDLSSIYNKAGGYEFSLPQSILESYLSGKAFDHPVPYTAEELDALNADINDLYQKILEGNPSKNRTAVMTAGAPGSGKTIKMRQELADLTKQGIHVAYTDPDDVCLKGQTRTYLADIEKGDGSFEARKGAYDKWRPGSNAANQLILANLIREGYAFYFGATSTSPQVSKFFEFLKKQGYSIRLIHVSAPDDVRWESIKERDKTFVQTTEKDTAEKGLLLPQRINDYLQYADQIDFYYRGAVKEDAVVAASWDKSGARLHIRNPELYDKIKAIHNLAVETLQKPELRWEDTVEARVKETI